MKKDKNILITKHLSGDTTPDEEKEILDWVKEDSENEKEFIRIKEFWNISANLKITRNSDTEKAWEDFKSLAQSEPQPLIEKSNFGFLKIAASIILLVGLFVFVKSLITNSTNTVNVKEVLQATKNNHDTNIKYINYSTTDSATTFILQDSSIIHLNKHSSFVFPEKFSSTERSVLLNGEAFFEIKHTSVPFVIICKQTRTIVMGTSFNIKGYESDKKVVVSVVTGTVQLCNQNNCTSERIILTENERGTYEDGNASLSKTKYTDKDFVWWKKNTLKTKIKRFIKKIKQKIS
ncbi:MAG: FecR family protein [Bacteroidia bacterium]